MSKTEELKKAAGVRAVDFVRTGMLVGLGTGSTAEFAIEELSRRIRDGRLSDISCVPSSERTKNFAEALGLDLVELNSERKINVTIDGADEIDSDYNLIKGGGGALLREKVLAQNSERNVIVADESKLSRRLGNCFPVPIEVLRFAVEAEKSYLETLGGEAELRLERDGSPFLTDQGNLIIDWISGEMEDPSYFADLTIKKSRDSRARPFYRNLNRYHNRFYTRSGAFYPGQIGLSSLQFSSVIP